MEKEIEKQTKLIDSLSGQIEDTYKHWPLRYRRSSPPTIREEMLAMKLKQWDVACEERKQLRVKETQIRTMWNLKLDAFIAASSARDLQAVLGDSKTPLEGKYSNK